MTRTLGALAFNPSAFAAASQPVSQPVTGAPTPVPPGTVGGSSAPSGSSGSSIQQSTSGGGGTSGSTYSSPTPNPYNLPDDLVQGQQQGDQLSGLLEQFEQSRQSANQANEQRYQQAIAGYNQLDQDYAARTQQLMGELEGYGAGYRQDLQDRFSQQSAGLTQDMINRGLYNSTSLDQARQGLSRQQQRQSLTLEDMLTRQRMDYGAQLSGQELANRPRVLEAIERRNDVGPSYQDVAGVSGAVGQSQANVPDYLSALGGQGSARAGTGGALPSGGGGGGLGDPSLTQYRTPNTRYSITSRGGSGVANPLSLSGSRRSSGSRTGSSGGSGGGGGAGGSGEFDSNFPGGGDRSGGQVNQSVQGGGGGGSGNAVTIVVNEDGTYFDATNGQNYATYEELMQARRERQDTRGQAPGTDPNSPTPADPSTRPPDQPQEPPQEEQSVLTDNSGNELKDPEGNPITLEGQGDKSSWYMGLPPIYWSYFYGNIPGIGIMQGQTIAAGIQAAMRKSGLLG